MSAIPEQVAHCGCEPDDYRPCDGEFYSCQCCGRGSGDPMPYAEPMDDPRIDPAEASAWWFYCRSCAFEWILDGADVRRVLVAA